MASEHFGTAHGKSASARYEEFFVPVIGAPLASDLVDFANLQPGERVVDAACGTGIVARFAAEKVGPTGAVAGVDINPGMLQVAQMAMPPEAPVAWHEASIENMPLPADAYDVVLCQMGLQFVADRSAALQEMRRVLRDGGRVCLNVPGPASPVFESMAAAMEHCAGRAAAGFVRHVFALHDADELGAMLHDAGFRDVDVKADMKILRLPSSRDFLWQYVQSTPLAAVTAKLDDTAREQLEREVVDQCHHLEADGVLNCRQRIVQVFARN